jgi:hypothetical protein
MVNLNDGAKIVIGLALVVVVLYCVNSYNSPKYEQFDNQGKSKTPPAYPNQVYDDSGDYYNNNSLKLKKGNIKPKSAGDINTNDEWEAYFTYNNNVTGKAQLRDQLESYKPMDEAAGLYANYDIPLKRRKNKLHKQKDIDPSFDPDMYDPENLLPQEMDEDWFEVIDKPINLKGRLLRLENPLGINTINETLKIPNLDLRPSPPCPKFNVSPWNNSTVEPDTNIKTLY